MPIWPNWRFPRIPFLTPARNDGEDRRNNTPPANHGRQPTRDTYIVSAQIEFEEAQHSRVRRPVRFAVPDTRTSALRHASNLQNIDARQEIARKRLARLAEQETTTTEDGSSNTTQSYSPNMSQVDRVPPRVRSNQIELPQQRVDSTIVNHQQAQVANRTYGAVVAQDNARIHLGDTNNNYYVQQIQSFWVRIWDTLVGILIGVCATLGIKAAPRSQDDQSRRVEANQETFTQKAKRKFEETKKAINEYIQSLRGQVSRAQNQEVQGALNDLFD